ncbi:MAG: acetyltransferase [Verrucomicrobiota bacterium]
MERLIIVGASDFGREVLSWALQVPESARTWEAAGFLDDRPQILDGYGLPCGILGAPETYSLLPDDRMVVAIGEPQVRKKYVDLLEERGAHFTSVIHPSVVMGLNNKWGTGCIFCPGVVITTNVTIGNHVVFNCQSGAGHDAVIGSFCTLSGAVDITGHVTLEEGVFVGSHAAILPHTRIGKGALVGAGSVVLRRVKAGNKVFGVPAMPIGTVDD